MLLNIFLCVQTKSKLIYALALLPASSSTLTSPNRKSPYPGRPSLYIICLSVCYSLPWTWWFRRELSRHPDRSRHQWHKQSQEESAVYNSGAGRDDSSQPITSRESRPITSRESGSITAWSWRRAACSAICRDLKYWWPQKGRRFLLSFPQWFLVQPVLTSMSSLRLKLVF